MPQDVYPDIPSDQVAPPPSGFRIDLFHKRNILANYYYLAEMLRPAQREPKVRLSHRRRPHRRISASTNCSSGAAGSSSRSTPKPIRRWRSARSTRWCATPASISASRSICRGKQLTNRTKETNAEIEADRRCREASRPALRDRPDHLFVGQRAPRPHRHPRLHQGVADRRRERLRLPLQEALLGIPARNHARPDVQRGAVRGLSCARLPRDQRLVHPPGRFRARRLDDYPGARMFRKTSNASTAVRRREPGAREKAVFKDWLRAAQSPRQLPPHRLVRADSPLR